MPPASLLSEIVGRDGELSALAEAVAHARQGRGSFTLLAGEPGIGKTALARAFAELAAADGLVVVWGRAWEAGGAPPFWPWVEVLRGLVAELPATTSAWRDVPNSTSLDRLLPELGARRTGLAAPVLDDATMRFQTCDAIAGILRRSARDAALAIVLDDLHAADRASLEVLRFVAARLRDAPVAFVGTFREAEARLWPDTAEVLAKAAREARTLQLGPLDRPAVGSLVRRAGLEPEAGIAERLVARTEGNPLFVVETLRLWRARGGDDGTIPDSVRDVVRQRLALLSAETRALLELGALQGREVDVAWLVLAADAAEGALRERLRPALAADLVAEREPGRLVFTHVLFRDALYQGLPEARRVALHLTLAEALEKRHAVDARARVMGLAHHYLEAAALAGLDRALRWARVAAERAVELQAHEEAVALLGRALAAIDLYGARDNDDDLRRADVLLALGLANMRAYEAERGKAACLEAAAIARARGDVGRLAQAALAFGVHLMFGLVDPDLVHLLEEALAAIGPEETPLRARLLARLAAALQPHADPLLPIALAREAIDIARRRGDATTRLECLTSGGSAMNYFAEPAERIPLATEMAAIAASLGDEVRHARALVRLTLDHLEAGDGAAADRAIAQHARVAAALRLPVFTWVAPLLAASRAMIAGRFGEAERALAEAEATPGRPTGIAAQLTLAGLRAGLGRAATRLDQHAERETVALTMHMSDPWYPLAFRASHAALTGDAAELARVLAEAGPQLAAWRHRQSLAWLAEAAIAAHDAGLGNAIYALLAPLSHRCHMWGVATMVCEGPLSEPLGRLASMLGRHDDAVHHLEDAHRRAATMGARPFSARAAHALALALEARAGVGDALRANALRGEARRTGEALGMPGLLAAIDRSGAAPPAPVGATALGPTPILTEPQHDVWSFSLVREGELWTVTHGGRLTRLKDSRGLQILEQLVAAPNREMHVLELIGASEAGDAGDALDAQAIKAYRERVTDLREELEEARLRSDLGRVERLQDELERVAQQLAQGVGLGGKARREASNVERARINVRRRLVLAIDRIAVDLPALGRHLAREVKTGVMCVYRPHD